MKAPSKSPAKKPTTKKTNSPKNASSLSFSQAMELTNTSVEAFKSYADYKRETEVTKRTQIEGQKEIILGEQNLEKARIENNVRLVELDRENEKSLHNHEQAMKSLLLAEREVDRKGSLQDRVMRQLENEKITAEQAALLLYGEQE